jgi:hypothetical protein
VARVLDEVAGHRRVVVTSRGGADLGTALVDDADAGSRPRVHGEARAVEADGRVGRPRDVRLAELGEGREDCCLVGQVGRRPGVADGVRVERHLGGDGVGGDVTGRDEGREVAGRAARHEGVTGRQRCGGGAGDGRRVVVAGDARVGRAAGPAHDGDGADGGHDGAARTSGRAEGEGHGFVPARDGGSRR